MKIKNSGTNYNEVILVLETVEEFQVLKQYVADCLDSTRGSPNSIAQPKSEQIKGQLYQGIDSEAVRQRRSGVEGI